VSDRSRMVPRDYLPGIGVRFTFSVEIAVAREADVVLQAAQPRIFGFTYPTTKLGAEAKLTRHGQGNNQAPPVFALAFITPQHPDMR